VKHNAVLQSFSWAAGGTQVGDITGVALAEAVKHNAVLQSFSWDANGTQVGDRTDIALRECVEQMLLRNKAQGAVKRKAR